MDLLHPPLQPLQIHPNMNSVEEHFKNFSRRAQRICHGFFKFKFKTQFLTCRKRTEQSSRIDEISTKFSFGRSNSRYSNIGLGGISSN